MSGPTLGTTSSPLATLDTCVLVPGGQRDFLLQVAAEGGYQPIWSTGTLDELDRVIARMDARRGRLDRPDARRRLIVVMQTAFPGATIDAVRERLYPYDLKDSGDGHVAHAAIISGASILVTDDTRAGFTTSTSLQGAGVSTLLTPQFAARVVKANPDAGIQALQALSERQTRQPRTPVQILDDLVKRYRMDQVAELLRPLL